MKGAGSDELLVDAPKARLAFLIRAEVIARQFCIILQTKKGNAKRNIMHQLMQSGQAIALQPFHNHASRKGTYFNDVILKAKRPRLTRERVKNNGRIGKAMVFAPENELRAL